MERQSTFAKGGDYRAVRGPERESLIPYLMVSTYCRKHADFSTGVDHVELARDAVSDEKKVTVISRSTGRHQWAEKAFPDQEQAFLHMVASLPNQAWYQQGVGAAEAVGGAEESPDFCCRESRQGLPPQGCRQRGMWSDCNEAISERSKLL